MVNQAKHIAHDTVEISKKAEQVAHQVEKKVTQATKHVAHKVRYYTLPTYGRHDVITG